VDNDPPYNGWPVCVWAEGAHFARPASGTRGRAPVSGTVCVEFELSKKWSESAHLIATYIHFNGSHSAPYSPSCLSVSNKPITDHFLFP
jgi:hypothetical protein